MLRILQQLLFQVYSPHTMDDPYYCGVIGFEPMPIFHHPTQKAVITVVKLINLCYRKEFTNCSAAKMEREITAVSNYETYKLLKVRVSVDEN